MIKGVKKSELTPATILQRISEFDVFRYYMGHRKWELNKATNSPFHVDDNPSFLIGNKNGYLYYIDFADTDKRGDCFDFVKDLFYLSSLHDALLMVDRDFGLGIVSDHNLGEYKKIKAEYKQPEELLGKRYSYIQVVTRKFTREELDYWNDYHQDIEDLRRENIYSIAKVYLNRKLFSIKETEMRFGYYYDGHWKIYRPYGDKKTKWVPNNVPITTLEGIGNLDKEKPCFINKSKKDFMVIKKIYPYSCAVQNEGIACFSEENVTTLKERSSSQILSFDSDITGVANSQQITQLFGFGYCNVPRQYLSEGIKDWADLVKEYGMEVIINYLKEKGIL